MYVVFDKAGMAGGAYVLGVNCDSIPADAVKISDDEWREFIASPGSFKWDGHKIVSVPLHSVEGADQ
jgi:hypothetical protein